MVENKSTGSASCFRHWSGKKRHGMSRSPEHRAWEGMKQRCQNPNHKDYPDYGGRGITVCARWLASFENFFADMGLRPSCKHSIDRFPNNDGNYEPGNCRWATWTEQHRNKRSNHVLVFLGESLTISEWSKKLGISAITIQARLRHGWSIEKVLAKNDRPHARKLITFRGETLCFAEWSERFSLPRNRLSDRLKQGWTVEQALTIPAGTRR